MKIIESSRKRSKDGADTREIASKCEIAKINILMKINNTELIIH